MLRDTTWAITFLNSLHDCLIESKCFEYLIPQHNDCMIVSAAVAYFNSCKSTKFHVRKEKKYSAMEASENNLEYKKNTG